jgi:hypothetical protein
MWKFLSYSGRLLFLDLYGFAEMVDVWNFPENFKRIGFKILNMNETWNYNLKIKNSL